MEIASTSVLAIAQALGAIGNILIIIIIARTPGMRGVSGALMINQAAADVIQKIISLVSICVAPFQMAQFQIHLRLSLFALQGVVSHSIAALSANLYLAICMQHMYKSKVTMKRVYVFLGCSWTFNIAIACTSHTVQSFHSVDLTSLNIIHIRLTSSNCWFLVLMILNTIVAPFCLVAASFLRIRSFTNRPSMTNILPSSVRKVMLSHMIHIMAIIYLISSIPIFVAISVEVPLKGFKAIALTVNSIYHILKPFLYIKLYKPFRETVTAMLGNPCQNRVLPSQQDQILTVQTKGNKFAHRQSHHQQQLHITDANLYNTNITSNIHNVNINGTNVNINIYVSINNRINLINKILNSSYSKYSLLGFKHMHGHVTYSAS
ncbi:adenosine receptor A3-like [Haliotis cracherodii]|uniref:adenosine receptor A3-like n=1 Tax=Haliotis cracherodii TaxID=6455 RepID=UPI0039EACCBB